MNAVRTASAIVSAVGLVTLAIAWFAFQSRLGQIRNWKPVNAQVSRAWMEENQGSESTSYSAHYELTYIVDGKTIRAAAKSEDPLLVGPDLVQARIARHAPGTQGVVYVHPDDPSKVRLNLGKNSATLGMPLWLLLAGASLLLFAVSLWLMGTPAVDW
jgi:hypothetical protein